MNMNDILAVSLLKKGACRRLPHGVRNQDARHPNFCRDLTREPMSAEEWASLQAWQRSSRDASEHAENPVPQVRGLWACRAAAPENGQHHLLGPVCFFTAPAGTPDEDFSALEHADSKGR